MEKQVTMQQSYRAMIIVGFLSIVASFLIYTRYDYSAVTQEMTPSLERVAVAMYVILFMSFGAIGYGLFKFYKIKIAQGGDSIFSIISNSINNKRSKQIFVATSIAYGIFFSLTSGILVYQPEVIFSQHYGALVPSVHITPCCGPAGYMPEIVGYMTEHVGFKIIPINFVLQVTVSFLVGLNFALASKAFSMYKKTGGMSGFGAVTGLFIACPTCAGTLLSALVGAGAAGVFTIALSQLQTVFIAASIPVLLATPVLMARNIRKFTLGSCAVDFKP
ncbi:MAG TPA: hypothetical protein VLD38_05915 [Nitrosopumilaceae archaeon]|nr:hypothetical protein [Nitrosopumilaceae archaeon]